MRDIHANLACVRSNTNFRKTKTVTPKQFRLALVPLVVNPNRPSRFDLHRHFLGIYRSPLPFIKHLIWVHMDQTAFELLSTTTVDVNLMCRRGAFIVCMWRGSLRTGPNEWSQWIFSFKHMAATAGQLGASDLPPVSTAIRLRQMQEFDGCRRWPWPQSY